jgi:hypothetical protein
MRLRLAKIVSVILVLGLGSAAAGALPAGQLWPPLRSRASASRRDIRADPPERRRRDVEIANVKAGDMVPTWAVATAAFR